MEKETNGIHLYEVRRGFTVTSETPNSPTDALILWKVVQYKINTNVVCKQIVFLK